MHVKTESSYTFGSENRFHNERGIPIMKVRISSIASALFSPLRNRPVYLNISQGTVLPKSRYGLQQLAASLKCDTDNLVVLDNLPLYSWAYYAQIYFHSYCPDDKERKLISVRYGIPDEVKFSKYRTEEKELLDDQFEDALYHYFQEQDWKQKDNNQLYAYQKYMSHIIASHAILWCIENKIDMIDDSDEIIKGYQ